MFVIVQQTTPTVLIPGSCKQLELTFQPFSQSHNAPSLPEDIIIYKSASEVKMESVGTDFREQDSSSASQTWVSSNQPGIASYDVSSSGFNAANSVAPAATDKKLSNRATGPRKPKAEVAVSTLQFIITLTVVLSAVR